MITNQLEKYMDWIEDASWQNINTFQKVFKSFLPYNFSINKEQGTARFSMSVAGYGVGDIDVAYSDGLLIVKNKPTSDDKDELSEFIHRGLAMRLFEMAIPINPRYEIDEAILNHGLLTVTFKKVKNTAPVKVAIKTT
jgi:HSP20 family molecular chaperone IbpA